MTIARTAREFLDVAIEQAKDSDDALSMALVRDNARRSLERTRDEIAAPGDNNRSLPLPVPGPEEVTIRQALEAAFLQLEDLKRRSDAASGDDVDPLDWSEELLEAVDIAHLSRARR